MKYIFLVISCLILTSAWCQDSLILTSWNKLTSAIIKRAEVFESISQDLSKIFSVDSNDIREISERKVALVSLVGLTDTLNGNFITRIYAEDRKLTASFSKMLKLMISDPTFSSKNEAVKFQVLLMAVENQINSATKQFNALIRAKNRVDLEYP